LTPSSKERAWAGVHEVLVEGDRCLTLGVTWGWHILVVMR